MSGELSQATNRPVISGLRWILWCLGLRCVMVVWQLGCRGSYHFLRRSCVNDAVPLYQYTHGNWYLFRRPRRDDRLSRPPGVLIQRPTGLELRTRAARAATNPTLLPYYPTLPYPTPPHPPSQHQATSCVYLLASKISFELKSERQEGPIVEGGRANSQQNIRQTVDLLCWV